MDNLTSLSCFGFLFEKNKDNLQKTAVLCGEMRISFAEFFDSIKSLSAILFNRGVTPGSTAAIVLPNCPEMIIAFYALNRLGAAANILSPALPRNTIKEHIINSGCAFVIAREDYCLPGIGFLKSGDSFFEAVKAGAALPDPGDLGGGELAAALINGGGTTGEAKTAVLSSSALNCVAGGLAFIDYDHGSGDEFSLLVLPASHAFGLAAAMHFPLSRGFGCITVEKFNPARENDTIKNNPVTFLCGVPQMYKKLLGAGNFHGAGLRLMFCGGDYVSESLIEKVNSAVIEDGGSARLFAGYGLTEACSVCTLNSRSANRCGSAGRPIEGVKLKILDDNLNELPVNTRGEIAVGGKTLMNGFLNSDCEASFVEIGDERFFLTGDYGRTDEDGFLFFEGRKKRMSVISGYNVYHTDIEKTASELEFVDEACCARDDSKIRLFVTLAKKTDNAPELISGHILNRLGRFCVPAQLTVVEELPKTPLGKTDYKKL